MMIEKIVSINQLNLIYVVPFKSIKCLEANALQDNN